MNGTNDKQRQIQDCFSPGRGSAVKAVGQNGAPAPRSALAWTGRCLRVDVPPEELKNCIFEIQFARFGTYLLATFY